MSRTEPRLQAPDCPGTWTWNPRDGWQRLHGYAALPPRQRELIDAMAESRYPVEADPYDVAHQVVTEELRLDLVEGMLDAIRERSRSAEVHRLVREISGHLGITGL